MPSYKLYYFNGRGRAEVIRVLFAVADVKYEDCRIEQPNWPALKPDTPQGTLPVLEIDGRKMCQSTSILRYLAREFGLAGRNSDEQAKTDELIQTWADLFGTESSILFAADNKRAELTNTFLEDTVPKYCSFLETKLLENKVSTDFIVGTGITVGDVVVFTSLQFATDQNSDILEPYPKLAAHRKRMEKWDKIADWLKKRPTTSF